MAPAEGARRRAPVEAAGLRFRRPPPEAPASQLSSVPGPRGASRLPVAAKAGKFGHESRARAGRGRSTFRSVLASARARLFSPSAPNMPRRNHEDSRLAARWEKSRNCGLSARPPGSGSQASCSQFRIMYAVHWWDCTNHTTGIEMEGLSCGRRVIAFDMLQKAITQTTA